MDLGASRMALGYWCILRVTAPLCTVIHAHVLNYGGRGVRSGGHPIPAPAAPLVAAVGVLGGEACSVCRRASEPRRGYTTARVVEVTGLHSMCGGRSKAQPQPARDLAPHAARRGQPAVEFRLVVDPRHEPGEQDEVGHGVQTRPPGYEHGRLTIHHHAAIVLVG